MSSDSIQLYYSIEEIINEPEIISENIIYRGCRFPNEKLEESEYHYR